MANNLDFSPSRVQGLSLNGEEQQPNFVALFEARMAELVDAHGSGPCSSQESAGSIPVPGTFHPRKLIKT